MAVIGKIRQYSVWIFVAIILAMFGFLIQDAFTHGVPALGGAKGVGSVSGQTIEPKVFERRLEMAKENQKQQSPNGVLTAEMESQINDQMWNSIIDENIYKAEYQDLGLEVTGPEIKDLVVGDNIHPIAQQYLVADKQTGRYDRNQILQFISSLDKAQPQQRMFWEQFEDYLVKERTKEKYNKLVQNGLFITDLEAKEDFIANNKFATIQYIGINLSTILDKDIDVSDADIKDYINLHQEDYKREQAKSIEYVSYDINVRAEDTAIIMSQMNAQKTSFLNAINDSSYVGSNGIASGVYVPKGLFPLPEGQLDIAYSSDSGTILGPMLDGDKVIMIKVGGSKKDTIATYKASHILLKPAGGSKEDTAKSMAEAQEIIKKIKGGADFATMAKEKSQDPGSAIKGGDLGWFPTQQMVKPFGDAIKKAKLGELTTAVSQFGVHIIKLTAPKSTKSVKLAKLESKIEASSATEKLVYAEASKFRAAANTPADFEKAVKEMGIVKRSAANIKPNDKVIIGLTAPRELVRWMYEKDRKIGDVSSALSIGNKYVIAVLTKEQEEGIAKIEDVRDQVKPLVAAIKKKEMLDKKVEAALEKNPSNFEAIAKELNQGIMPAENIGFNNPALPNFPNEFFVVGYAMGMKEGKISKPLKGTNGVFLVKALKFTAPTVPTSFANERQSMMMMESQRATTESMGVLKDKANIKDFRYMYY